MRRTLPLIALAFAAAIASAPGLADTWPSRPIKLVVPFATGGVNDIMARLIQEPLSKALKQPVIVDNKPGAGGIVGTEYVAHAAPDGYTIGLVASFLSSAIALNPKLPFDPVNDVTPITMIGYNNLLLVVHPSVQATNVRELIALAKAKPGSIHYASTGIGTSQHYAGEMVKVLAGVDIAHVPYKGGGPAINDLIGGQVEMMFSSASIRPYLESGRARALAVSYAQRSPLFPTIPTLDESGLPGFSLSEWYGVVGPAKLPPEIVKRLNEELGRILRSPEIVEKLAQPGVEVQTSTPEAFAERVKTEIVRFKDIARRADMKPE